MRKRVVAVVIFSAWFVDGCASTQCEMGEIKVADTCIRPRARDGSIDDAASVTAGPNTLDASGPREPDLLRDARPPSDSMRDAGFYQRDDASVGDACSPSPEVCNGVDDDCNAQIDDGLTVYCWIDADGDGFAPSSAVGTSRCGECGVGETNVDPTGAMQSDCDDSDARRSPSLSDVCGDSIDNDCDGTPDDEQKNACGGSCSVQLEFTPGGPCTNGLLGACSRTGTYECQTDKSIKCSAEAVTGTAETCDGVDNDCDGSTDEDGVCASPRKAGLGQGCSSTADCDDGLSCAEMVCRRNNGTSCGEDSECRSTSCGADGRCADRGPLEAVCNSAADCQLGLICSSTGRCKRAGGQPCSENSECVEGVCAPSPVQRQQSVCRPAGGPQEPCREESDCNSNLDVHCDFMTGECRRREGAFCMQHADCFAGFSCEEQGNFCE